LPNLAFVVVFKIQVAKEHSSTHWVNVYMRAYIERDF
jgi:hypothetical protein